MIISAKFFGRLGNQLFQYATLKNLSLLNFCEINYDINFSWDDQKCLLNNFDLTKSVEAFISETYSQPVNPYFYDEKIKNIKRDTVISGYFQNEKYFEEHKDIIKNELTLKNELSIECLNFINKLKENNKKIVGIHIRRGDYCPHTGGNNKIWNEDKIFLFMKKVLLRITEEDKNIKIIFFIGGKKGEDTPENNKTDIEWLNRKIREHKKNNYDFIVSPGSIENNVLKDYCLMSNCDYFIHTNNSSFSWWASYINPNPNKKIFINKDFENINSKEFILL